MRDVSLEEALLIDMTRETGIYKYIREIYLLLNGVNDIRLKWTLKILLRRAAVCQ